MVRGHKKPECAEHSCRRIDSLKQCHFCQRMFCPQHIQARPAGSFRIDSKNYADYRDNWDSTNSHPDFAYTAYLEEQEERKKETYRNALANILRLQRRKVSPNSHTKHSPVSDYDYPRIDRTPPVKKALVVLAVLLLFLFYTTNPTFRESINNAIKSIPNNTEDSTGNSSFSTLKNVSMNLVVTFNKTFNELIAAPDTREIEMTILKYTNDARTKNGVRELIWDDKLASIAREHSQDMTKNNFFSHDNLRGEDPTKRAKRNRYPLYKDLGGGYYTEGIAENIGKMPTGNVEGMGYVRNNADAIAKAQVQSWMESLGHRRNILDSSYSKLGIGVAYDGTYYLSTQNFW